MRKLDKIDMVLKYKLILFVTCFNLSNFEIVKASQFTCGTRDGMFKAKIHRGNTVHKGEWPWIVAFIYEKNEKMFCGGSLISEKHVLSGKFSTILTHIKLDNC